MPEVSISVKKEMMLRHAKALADFKGEYTAVREMRKHFGWYTAGMKHAADLRRNINSCESLEDLTAILKVL